MDTEGNSDLQNKNDEDYKDLNSSPLIAHHSTCTDSADATPNSSSAPVDQPCRFNQDGGIAKQRKACFEKCFPTKVSARLASTGTDR